MLLLHGMIQYDIVHQYNTSIIPVIPDYYLFNWRVNISWPHHVLYCTVLQSWWCTLAINIRTVYSGAQKTWKGMISFRYDTVLYLTVLDWTLCHSLCVNDNDTHNLCVLLYHYSSTVVCCTIPSTPKLIWVDEPDDHVSRKPLINNSQFRGYSTIHTGWEPMIGY